MGYSLCLYMNDVGSWDKSIVSVHMFARGLVSRFGRMPGVDLRAVVNPRMDAEGEGVPQCDVLLIHDYFASDKRDFAFDVGEIRKRARKIALFLEFGSIDADMSFTYLPTWCKPVGPQRIIELPCEHSLLAQTTRPKNVRKVLLDHNYWRMGVDGKYTIDNICLEIYRDLAPLRGRFDFYQLDRFPEDSQVRPSWIVPLPMMPYPEYLAKTADMGTFVMTHPGSYNHTVIDMAARGIRVIAVAGCASAYLARPLNLLEVGGPEEIRTSLENLDKLPKFGPQLMATTDMDEVVRIMHEQFCQWKREEI